MKEPIPQVDRGRLSGGFNWDYPDPFGKPKKAKKKAIPDDTVRALRKAYKEWQGGETFKKFADREAKKHKIGFDSVWSICKGKSYTDVK